MAAESEKQISLFKFLEIMNVIIARNEKNKTVKTIDDVPAHIIELIKECGDEDTIHSYDDCIEWILDQVYIHFNGDELLWLHLLFGNNEKFLEEIATGNKIPLQDLHLAMLKRLLKDMEENFDAYAEYSEVTFERILKKSVDDN